MLNPNMFQSKGGGLSQFFVDFPKNQGEALNAGGAGQPWKRTIRVLDDQDPYYYNQHMFTNPADGKRVYMYCLGSPADGWRGREEELELTPEGVAACQSIIVPGVGRPLHEIDDGGETQFHFLIWEWESQMLKVLAHKAASSVYTALATMHANQGTLTGYDIILQAQPKGGYWEYTAQPLMQSKDIDAVASEIEAQYQPPEDNEAPHVLQAYNPVMTKEAIEQRLQRLVGGGGGAQWSPTQGQQQATPPPQQQNAAPNISFDPGFNAPVGANGGSVQRLPVGNEQAPVQEPAQPAAGSNIMDRLRQQQ